MGKRRTILSPDHAQALIKEAIGIIYGDHDLEVEAAAEIAAIEAEHAANRPTPKAPPVPRGTAKRRSA